MSSELLPCPFCGGEADVLHKSSPSGNWWQIGCVECEISTRHYLRRKRAVSVWNTRAERTCKAVYVEQTDPYDQRWYECDSCGGYLFSYEEVGDIDLSAEMYCSKCGARVEGD